MSNLTDIRQAAYERLRGLLDQEILNRRGEAPTLERYRQWLDTAFYLLAWGNFEYLTRKQTEAVAMEEARSHGRVKHAWSFLLERIKDYSVRKQLDLVFHGRDDVIRTLNKQYTVRNESAHDYRKLPPETKDLPGLIGEWEKLVDEF